MTSELEALRAERAAGRGWGSVRTVRLDAVDVRAGDRLLDIGCSAGDYVEALRARGAEAFGVDLLTDHSWSGGYFVRADATRLPVGTASVDSLIAFETLEHVSDPAAALAEWFRVCRRQLVLSVPNSEPLPWGAAAGMTYHHYVDRTHVQFYDEASLRAAVGRAGFVVDSVQHILPIHPFVPALHALGFSERWSVRIGQRLTRLTRRRVGSSLLLRATRP